MASLGQFSWPTYPVTSKTQIYKILKDNGSGIAVIATNDGTNFLGINQNAVVTTVGKVQIQPQGPSQVLVGASPVTMGELVTSDASGNIVLYAPAIDGNLHCYLGNVISLGQSAGAAGTYVFVNVTPYCSRSGGGGGSGVSSFNTRTGAVVSAANDYSFAQLSGVLSSSQVPTGGSATAFLNGAGTYTAPTGVVTSVFGRTGAVVGASADYSAVQFQGKPGGNCAAPTYSFLGVTNFGMVEEGGADLVFCNSGNAAVAIGADFQVDSNSRIGFSNTSGDATSGFDIGFQRTSATSIDYQNNSGLSETLTGNGNIISFLVGGGVDLDDNTGEKIEVENGNGVQLIQSTNVCGLNGTFSCNVPITVSNCSSGASPAACGSALAGAVAFPTGVTPTLVINDTAVTSISHVMLTMDESLTISGVTCNTTLATIAAGYAVTARVPGTSVTIQLNATVTTNKACASFIIVN